MKRIIALMAMVAVGLGVCLYPQAAQWNQYRKDYKQNVAVVESARLQTPRAENALLLAAQEYNERLLQKGAQEYREALAASDLDYQAQLRNQDLVGPLLADTGSPSPNEALGRVSIPQLDISVPIYHGATEKVLAVGAGHVYGTSLPVGGPGTHTVITAHSRQGMDGRFTRIQEMQIGDEFFISAAGQTLRYVVDDIMTVLPTEIEPLRIIPGEDRATLLTCTPPGINTHRLLVRGVRAELPAFQGEALELKPLPFPTWAVIYFGGIALAGVGGYAYNRATAPKPVAERVGSVRPAQKTAKVRQTNQTSTDSLANPQTKRTNSPRAANAPSSVGARKPQKNERQGGSTPRGRHVLQKGGRP